MTAVRGSLRPITARSTSPKRPGKRDDHLFENPCLGPIRMIGLAAPLTNRILVLDMDETIIHSFTEPAEIKALNRLDIWGNPDYLPLRSVMRHIFVENSDSEDPYGIGKKEEIFIVLRPGLTEFLLFALSYFKDVLVWTAGQCKYAHCVLRKVMAGMPKGFTQIITRKTKLPADYQGLNKPLTYLFNRLSDATSKNTLIVDDREDVIETNGGNGILISRYEPSPTINALQKDDRTLIKLQNWLMSPAVLTATDISLLDKSTIFD